MIRSLIGSSHRKILWLFNTISILKCNIFSYEIESPLNQPIGIFWLNVFILNVILQNHQPLEITSCWNEIWPNYITGSNYYQQNKKYSGDFILIICGRAGIKEVDKVLWWDEVAHNGAYVYLNIDLEFNVKKVFSIIISHI